MILAKTIKGYGLGEAGEGRNITHQQKKLNEDELVEFRRRFDIPISDDAARRAEFYKPPEDSPEMQYLRGRRKALSGFVPGRRAPTVRLKPPKWEEFAEFFAGSEGREVSTTMAFVRLLARLLRDKQIGRYIVPIVPDEARTFGMEALFRQFGIYSHAGQLYEPVDSDTVLYYREATDGQILEEGITEAGAMSSFIAAGSSRSQPRAEHDPVLHLLLDVRLPADRRPALGRRRHALPRVCPGRHGRPHDLGRRGAPAPGRQQPPERPGVPELRCLRPLLCLRDGGDRSRRAAADVLRAGGRILLHHADERELRDADPADGLDRGHLPRHLSAFDA